MVGSCKDNKTLIGEMEVKGLENTKIEFHQGEIFMGNSDVWFNLKNYSKILLENKFLFYTRDNLKIEDLYTNSHDSIIYISFSNSKDDVLYFIDLKTKISEKTALDSTNDSISVEKLHFLQDSLYNVKDSIFKVLYKNNTNLKMTGYNKGISN